MKTRKPEIREPKQNGRRTGFVAVRLSAVQLMLPALIVAAAALLRSISFLPDDVSWFITLAEKTWSGETPYIDFVETNPPAAFLLYLPAILIGRSIGVAPEVVVTVITFVSTVASLWICGRLLLRQGLLRSEDGSLLTAIALAIFLILPGNTFAQREHFAALAVLPLVAVYAVRAIGGTPGLTGAVLAGAGGAIAVALKPHFALPILLPLGWVLWVRRSQALSLLFAAENLVVTALVILYGVMIVLLFPAYITEAIPLALTIYGAARMSALQMASDPATLLMTLSATVLLFTARRDIRQPVIAVTSLAALGFACAHFMQGKFYPYHAYPAIALLMMALGIAAVGRVRQMAATTASERSRRIGIGVLVASIFCLLAAGELNRFDFVVNYPTFFRTAEALAPAHPRVLSIMVSLVGVQMTRYLHGTWVERVPAQYIARDAAVLLRSGDRDAVNRMRIEYYARRDSEMLAESIRKARPDLILTDEPWLVWALEQPRIARELRSYREAAIVDKFGLWIRR